MSNVTVWVTLRYGIGLGYGEETTDCTASKGIWLEESPYLVSDSNGEIVDWSHWSVS